MHAEALPRSARLAAAGDVELLDVPTRPDAGYHADALRPHFELIEIRREDAHGRPLPPGVYWFGVDRNGEPLPPEWICAPLLVLACTRDERGESWGRLLAFADREGRRHEWAMPMEMLRGDGTDVRGELLRQGLIIATGQRARLRLADYIAQADPECYARCVERTGWHGGAFVFPHLTVGDDGERVIFQTDSTAGVTFASAGTLAEWRTHVAARCIGNSRLLFAVSASFAALLLGLTGDESGGIHLRGGSSSGKTTALRAAASVFGSADYVQRWRATANGIEAIAAQHCDCLLILDELGQVDPREAGEIAYMLANGQGKGRAGRSGGARARARWRVLFLSAGEISLGMHMLAAGKRARAGQEIRLADIEADAGRGLGVFERLHDCTDGAELARVLVDAAARHYGTAAPAFLTALQAERERLPEVVDGLRRAAIARWLPANASGQAQRVAARFALIGIAGELAGRYDITGWPADAALDAAHACFRSWLTGRGGAQEQEPQAMLEQVRRFLEAHGEARFSPIEGDPHDRPTINRAGFREHDRNSDDNTFYVLPEAFRAELCHGFDAGQVARVLADSGALLTGDGKNLTRKMRLPGMGSMRCYVIGPQLWTDNSTG